ncbi:cholesterol esterase [Longimycelium tulufanense]|uniref:Cholesterol esterase n=1 Tax=Longimycelium tulufanense TaxID=907463 RepID=A0A8J3FUJ9_9PSEU|nr:DUF6230 family protein [Longimycelium tulufanense]GGM35715.1 cholesterol esterase [Longimycelium tulufanense]
MVTETKTGRTRWLRFGAVFGGTLVAAGVLLTGIAEGTLNASFAVSGTSFKASANEMRGYGYAQYGDIDKELGDKKAHPVAVNAIKRAELDNFCQSVVVPAPVIGDVTMRIEAPGTKGMKAENLLLNAESIKGNLSLKNAEIGRDASTLNKGAGKGQPGSFGLQADEVTVTSLRQTAWSTTASTLSFDGMSLGLTMGKNECF